MAAIIGGAIGSSIPNIFGGFAPFPNTIATALLAYQSEAIGFGFGIKFQYSKRLVGALTNAEFNAMTPIDIGNIVEAHNTELIQRMKNEMPKWLDIQRDFIEASVSVEIAKANRTPSAWAEIIQAFSGAAGQQIADSLNTLDPVALGALLTANPILALIYSFASTNGGTLPPPPSPDPDPELLPEHIEPDEHPQEEHDINQEEFDHFELQKTFKQWSIQKEDVISGGNKTWTSKETNATGHRTEYNRYLNDLTIIQNQQGGSPSWASKILVDYRQRIQNFYNITL